MHSELVAITTDGHLHQWRWNAPEPPTPKKDGHCHSRAEDLNLIDTEKVSKLAAWNIRASIVTESGKVIQLIIQFIVEITKSHRVPSEKNRARIIF